MHSTYMEFMQYMSANFLPDSRVASSSTLLLPHKSLDFLSKLRKMSRMLTIPDQISWLAGYIFNRAQFYSLITVLKSSPSLRPEPWTQINFSLNPIKKKKKLNRKWARDHFITFQWHAPLSRYRRETQHVSNQSSIKAWSDLEQLEALDNALATYTSHLPGQPRHFLTVKGKHEKANEEFMKTQSSGDKAPKLVVLHASLAMGSFRWPSQRMGLGFCDFYLHSRTFYIIVQDKKL